MNQWLMASLGLGLTWALGFFVAGALARRSGPAEAAAGFPLGALIVTLLGMLLLLLGLPLARNPWLVASIGVFGIASLAYRRWGRGASAGSPSPPPRASQGDTALLALGAVLLLVQLGLLAGGMLRIPAIADWDAWAIWAFKAKAFYVDRGVTRYFAHGDDYYFTWPARPCLSAFYQAFVYTCLGREEAAAVRLVHLAFFVSLLLAFFESLRRAVAPGAALLSTALFASLPSVAYVATAGLANLVLGTYLLLATLSLERAREAGRFGLAVAAGLLLGGAALTRDEGLVLGGLIAVVASFSLPGRPRLGPAAAAIVIAASCSLPWLLLVAPFELWDLRSSWWSVEVIARAREHAKDAGEILRMAAVELTKPVEQTRSSPFEEWLGVAPAWPLFGLALLRVRSLRESSPLAWTSALAAVSGLLVYIAGFWLFPYQDLDWLRDNWLYVFDRHALSVLPLAAYATAVAFAAGAPED